MNELPNQLVVFFKLHINLTDVEINLIAQEFELKEIQKGTQLKEKNQVENHIYFLLNGIIRQYQVIEQREQQEQFYFVNSYFSEYLSFLSRTPSENILEALSNCRLLSISFDSTQKLYQCIPAFQKFGRLMAEKHLTFISEMNSLLLVHSVEERYLKLQSWRPEICKEIPQYMVASFIGISAEAFSRIKSKLLRRK